MKTLDIKSVTIGILATILVFVSIGANHTPENLGDIVVNSISIINGGHLKSYNIEGKISCELGTDASDSSGYINTYSAIGRTVTTVGSYKSSGSFNAYNSFGLPAATMSAGSAEVVRSQHFGRTGI